MAPDVGQSPAPHFGVTRTGHEVHLRTLDHLPRGSLAERFNARLAMVTTRAVGTMWCAYAFAAFDCLALPEAIRQGLYGLVQWTASFFLQLVLLSIVMVGQNSQAAASDARAAKTFEDTEVIVDRLDTATEGGLQTVLAAITELTARFPEK